MVIVHYGEFYTGLSAMAETINKARDVVSSEEFRQVVQPILPEATRLLEYEEETGAVAPVEGAPEEEDGAPQ